MNDPIVIISGLTYYYPQEDKPVLWRILRFCPLEHVGLRMIRGLDCGSSFREKQNQEGYPQAVIGLLPKSGCDQPDLDVLG